MHLSPTGSMGWRFRAWSSAFLEEYTLCKSLGNPDFTSAAPGRPEVDA